MTQINIRSLFAIVLLAQSGCVAVGFAFHYFYSSHVLVHGERAETRVEPMQLHGIVSPSADRSASNVTVDVARLQSSLREASGIALLWTCGLLAMTLYLIVGRFHKEQALSRMQPEIEALKQAQTLLRTQNAIIFGLAKLSDSRDSETGNHLERISQYVSLLAEAMRYRSELANLVTSDVVQTIGMSSVLHDIGKVGVADAVLRKPGTLTPAERVEMQQHTRIAEDCLREIERRLGTSNFLRMAREIAAAHHERWDGSGYPRGLVGDQIPLAARLVAVADVYDALASKRVYKNAMTHADCVRLIAEAAGTQFDPRVVEVFLQIHERFERVSLQFAESPDESGPADQASVESHVAQPSVDCSGCGPATALHESLTLVETLLDEAHSAS